MSDLANDAVTGARKEDFADFKNLRPVVPRSPRGGSRNEFTVEADKSVCQFVEE